MVRGWVSVPTFPDNLLLCPVRSLHDYLARKELLCHTYVMQLFTGLTKPYKAVPSQTLARWLKACSLMHALTLWWLASTAHGVPQLICNLQRSQKSATVSQICNTAQWSQKSGTFRNSIIMWFCMPNWSFLCRCWRARPIGRRTLGPWLCILWKMLSLPN